MVKPVEWRAFDSGCYMFAPSEVMRTTDFNREQERIILTHADVC